MLPPQSVGLPGNRTARRAPPRMTYSLHREKGVLQRTARSSSDLPLCAHRSHTALCVPAQRLSPPCLRSSRQVHLEGLSARPLAWTRQNSQCHRRPKKSIRAFILKGIPRHSQMWVDLDWLLNGENIDLHGWENAEVGSSWNGRRLQGVAVALGCVERSHSWVTSGFLRQGRGTREPVW